MTYDDVVAYGLSLDGAVSKRPFGPEPLVLYTPTGKTFCYMMGRDPVHIGIKCDPFEAELLRMACPAVKPGYHLHKRHWNSVYVDGTLPDAEIKRQVQNSYYLAMGQKEHVIALHS